MDHVFGLVARAAAGTVVEPTRVMTSPTPSRAEGAVEPAGPGE
jgi:hypothetical protein